MGNISRWLGRRTPSTDTAELSTVDTRADAERAITSASRDLAIVKGRKPRVDRVVAVQFDHLLRNHFGELAEVTMRGVG